jgi:hypothetical protein
LKNAWIFSIKSALRGVINKILKNIYAIHINVHAAINNIYKEIKLLDVLDVHKVAINFYLKNQSLNKIM